MKKVKASMTIDEFLKTEPKKYKSVTSDKKQCCAPASESCPDVLQQCSNCPWFGYPKEQVITPEWKLWEKEWYNKSIRTDAEIKEWYKKLWAE